MHFPNISKKNPDTQKSLISDHMPLSRSKYMNEYQQEPFVDFQLLAAGPIIKTMFYPLVIVFCAN